MGVPLGSGESGGRERSCRHSCSRTSVQHPLSRPHEARSPTVEVGRHLPPRARVAAVAEGNLDPRDALPPRRIFAALRSRRDIRTLRHRQWTSEPWRSSRGSELPSRPDRERCYRPSSKESKASHANEHGDSRLAVTTPCQQPVPAWSPNSAVLESLAGKHSGRDQELPARADEKADETVECHPWSSRHGTSSWLRSPVG